MYNKNQTRIIFINLVGILAMFETKFEKTVSTFMNFDEFK